jgi:hypothetical protein
MRTAAKVISLTSHHIKAVRIVKRVRLTVVYRTSREVRRYSIKAFAEKSRHL